MTTTDSIRATVLAALGDVVPEGDLDALDPRRPLQDQLELDSMDLLQFLEEVAARTGVDVPERDYRRVRTLEDCVAYVAAARARG